MADANILESRVVYGQYKAALTQFNLNMHIIVAIKIKNQSETSI